MAGWAKMDTSKQISSSFDKGYSVDQIMWDKVNMTFEFLFKIILLLNKILM